MCQIFYFLNFFCTLYFFQVFLLRRIFPGCNAAVTSLALLLFVFIRSLRSCGIAAAALPPAFIAALPLAFTAALPPTCIHSGIAAKRHCRQHAFTQRHCRQYAAALPPCGIAASIMQRHCRHAACTHSGIAASMHSQRHCRQHALVAALPPASTHSGIAAILSSVRGSAAQSELMLPLRFFSVYLVWASISFWGNNLLLQFLTMPATRKAPAKTRQTGSRNTYTQAALESF